MANVEAPAGASDVLARFLRYVQVDSPADPHNAEQTPSTACQHQMAALLGRELEALGAQGVEVDERAYVTATIPASAGCEALPALGLLAHIDTAPDAPGCGVQPQVVTYEGGTLTVGEANGVPVELEPEAVPQLASLVGEQLVTTDGTTLLGADDKAGVAEIMALAARLTSSPELPHPTLKLAFVPDEEIGHGAALLDLEKFGATWAYTVDGEALGTFNYECFTAAQVDLTITGKVVHPGDAKNRMINALTVWREFDALLPTHERPEHTEGYEGYYHALEINGTPAHLTVSYIVRDFDAARFDARLAAMQDAAEYLNRRYGAGCVALDVTPEYRNMAEHFDNLPFLIENALEANRQAGIEPHASPVRGGTDGAQLTFRGLPCPNIATGAAMCHSPREFIAVRDLELTVDVLQNLVALFARPQAS